MSISPLQQAFAPMTRILDRLSEIEFRSMIIAFLTGVTFLFSAVLVFEAPPKEIPGYLDVPNVFYQDLDKAGSNLQNNWLYENVLKHRNYRETAAEIDKLKADTPAIWYVRAQTALADESLPLEKRKSLVKTGVNRYAGMSPSDVTPKIAYQMEKFAFGHAISVPGKQFAAKVENPIDSGFWFYFNRTMLWGFRASSVSMILSFTIGFFLKRRHRQLTALLKKINKQQQSVTEKR